MRRLILVALLGVAATASFAQSASEGAEASRGREYRIGVEDVLKVVVWDEPQLSMSLAVRPDGKITLPLVNDIVVEGKTTDELRTHLTEALSRFVKDPDVTVIVERINSFKVFFLGEVNTKGVLTFGRPMRLLQAIAVAGGPGEFARRLWVIREVDGAEQRIKIDYKKLLEGDPSQENFYLKPDDMLLFE